MKSYNIYPIQFPFKKPSGTSRGVMTVKKSWFIRLSENDQSGWGECSIIEGLSPDYRDDASYMAQLEAFLKAWVSNDLNMLALAKHPSILFGLETALLDLKQGGNQRLFHTSFTRGKQKIQINGLIWMGTKDVMRQQLREKLDAGFKCVKLKIGAIDWSDEYELLRDLRREFPAEQLEIRVDANGAFSYESAQVILQQLATLDIHSIEQPIAPGQWEFMAKLCQNTPCPIALDEELISIHYDQGRRHLLQTIKPQYIILKPSLHGGFSGSKKWIEIAENQGVAWWMTSALESNLGLNAIAQVAATYDLTLPQGLGTGGLYTFNITSPLYLDGQYLGFDPEGKFEFDL